MLAPIGCRGCRVARSHWLALVAVGWTLYRTCVLCPACPAHPPKVDKDAARPMRPRKKTRGL